MKIIQKNIRHGISHISFKIDSLIVDTRIPFDIYIQKDKEYVIILEAGTLLTDKIYNILSNKEALYILKGDAGKQEVDCTSLQHYVEVNRDLNEKNIQFIYKTASHLFLKISDEKYSSLKMSCVESIVQSIIFLIQHNKKYLKETIEYFCDDYELDFHAIHVAIYTINLGNALGLDKHELLKLGIAGLLHDIGITKIDDDITQKSSELTPQEFEKIKQHPKRSVEIIEHNHIHNPYIINAVMHHHERYDGSGYPDKLHEHEISTFAAIVGICDVFDALTSNRPHRKKYTYFEALKLMMQDESMQNKFNHQYLQVFLKSLI